MYCCRSCDGNGYRARVYRTADVDVHLNFAVPVCTVIYLYIGHLFVVLVHLEFM